MALTLQQIITEADILAPNGVGTADKVLQLNAINGDFFNVVKIPATHRFAGDVAQTDYTLPAAVREKNIDLVQIGLLTYRNLQREAVAPTDITFSFDDASHTLTLSPAPYQSGLQGIVRYHRIATTTFTSDNLAASPDAPEEYHWSFVLGLAAKLAAAEDDAAKAANYEAEKLAAWNTAAQNYQTG